MLSSNCYKAYLQQNMNCNPLIFMDMRLPSNDLGLGLVLGLMVLEKPWPPLHNNLSERDIRE